MTLLCPDHHCKHQALWLLSLLLLATRYPLITSAAPTCGRVAVYISNTTNSGKAPLQYAIGTEWGNFPGEVTTQPLCEQPAAMLQSVNQLQAQTGNMKCMDVRGTPAVDALVNASLQAAWPQLKLPKGQDCWCATEGSYAIPAAVYMPYVHLRVLRVVANASKDQHHDTARRFARKILSSKAVHATNMPSPADEVKCATVQCKGDAALYAGNEFTSVVDGWYRVVRNESICQRSDSGDVLTIVFRLVEKC